MSNLDKLLSALHGDLVAMSLFTNAIHAIQAGVEDFVLGSDDEGRLKSAIRNVHAGVLLLFKTHLQQLSPQGSNEVLLKQDNKPVQLPDGSISFVDHGKKTADVRTIKYRFDSLLVSVDWKTFDKATAIRNEVEHYFTKHSQKLVSEAVADCFAIAYSFCTDSLQTDLKAHLSEKAWEQLIEIKAVNDAETRRCFESQQHFQPHSDFARESLRWYSCSECYSGLILFNPDGSAQCRSCGKIWSDSEIVAAVVSQAGAGDHYDAIKDGANMTVVDCPDCGAFTYVVAEAYCVNCECSCPSDCDLCGMAIPAEEIDGERYCSWCRNLLSKDD